VRFKVVLNPFRSRPSSSFSKKQDIEDKDKGRARAKARERNVSQRNFIDSLMIEISFS
jgi:hypothetical protein